MMLISSMLTEWNNLQNRTQMKYISSIKKERKQKMSIYLNMCTTLNRIRQQPWIPNKRRTVVMFLSVDKNTSTIKKSTYGIVHVFAHIDLHRSTACQTDHLVSRSSFQNHNFFSATCHCSRLRIKILPSVHQNEQRRTRKQLHDLLGPPKKNAQTTPPVHATSHVTNAAYGQEENHV